MSQIKFKKLTFRNFMSYGNTTNTFEFKDGLIMCYGSNGFGKSTIVEALNFALYGNSYRGGNKPDLINTMNPGAELSVELEFAICKPGTDEWQDCRVLRTMKAGDTNAKGEKTVKSKFDLFLLEDGKWIVQNKRAGFSQDDFEENYLGFNETLFKSSIAFNTQEAQPFMSLPAQKRRDITESLIMMQLGPWKKANNKRLNEATIAFDVASNEYKRLNESIANLDQILVQMKEEKKGNIADMKAEIERNNAQIEANKAEANTILAPIAEHERRIETIQSSIDGITAENGSKQVEIDAIDAKNKELNAKIVSETDLNNRIRVLEAGKNAVAMKSNFEIAYNSAKERLATVDAEYAGLGKDALVAEQTELERKKQADTNRRNEIGNRNTKLTTEISFIDTNINEFTRQANELKAKAEAVKPGVPCPLCGKPSTEDDVEHTKAELNRQLDALREKCRGFIVDKKAKMGEIANGNAEIADIDARRVQIDHRLTEIGFKITEIGAYENTTLFPTRAAVKNAKENYDGCIKTIANMGIEVSAVEGELASISNAFANNNAIREEIHKNADGIAQIRAAISANSVKISELKGEITEIRSKISEIRSNSNTVLSRNTQIAERNSDIAKKIAEMESADASDAVGTTERSLANAKRDRDAARERMNETSDTKAICNAITELCADDGMKKMVFDVFIPSFNKAVAHNLLRTNLPVTIKFDGKMDYTYEAGPGIAPTYKQLSQGQQRKVGFAIAMAFRDFAAMLGNFKLNFISFDEVIDQSTDDNAMREMLEMIRGMVPDIGCAFVITHRGGVVRDLFDYKLEVKNNGAYSRLGELEAI
jgi:DNA repair exonuclease SbcCD ATPase subunit